MYEYVKGTLGYLLFEPDGSAPRWGGARAQSWLLKNCGVQLWEMARRLRLRERKVLG